jgi:hypothetical protein
MDMSEMKVPDVSALVAFGKLGMEIIACRMLSLLSLVGVIALSAYVAYSPSYVGAACVGILALCCFVPALKAESKRKED